MNAVKILSSLKIIAFLFLVSVVQSTSADDADGDGVPDALDVCNYTPSGTAVDAEGRPLGDIDLDCDTDLQDYTLFQQGFTGLVEEPIGACCYPIGECVMQSEESCAGMWNGAESTCDPNPCAVLPVIIETVTIGNPANPGDARYPFEDILEFGHVDYVYNMAKYEVTAGQYTNFLNAVASADAYELYHPYMGEDPWGYGCGIQQHGLPGSYTYSVASDWADRPVTRVSWGDAARFANWLHNGQPTGIQDLTTTEDGSYFLDGAMTISELMAITRKPNANWVIPSEDEWYKAAYHKNDGVTGNYWDYPTASFTAPTSEAPPGTDMMNGSSNCRDFIDGENAIGPPYYRTEVGAYDAKPSDSAYGTFDQGGNVSEWTEGIAFYGHRVLRGGGWVDNCGGWGPLRASGRTAACPNTHDAIGLGFRVAQVP